MDELPMTNEVQNDKNVLNLDPECMSHQCDRNDWWKCWIKWKISWEKRTLCTGHCALVEHEIVKKSEFREMDCYGLPNSSHFFPQKLEMLQANIVKVSSSRIGSPLGIVKKKDGSFTTSLVTTYTLTVGCKYPMPIVRDILNKVGNSRNVISSFLCWSLYWTCLVEKSGQWKTLVTHKGLM